MIYPAFQRPIQYINGNPYQVFAEIKIEQVEKVSVNDVKKYLGCDTAFKVAKHGVYMFCDLIEEPEWEYVKKD